MKQTIYFIDAFASELFTGNQAGVCILDNPLSEELMQNIATENNLSETAFVVKEDENFSIRWFTPAREIELCGHATLASGYVLFHLLNYPGEEITFSSLSGKLKVKKKGDLLLLDFPSDKPVLSDNLTNSKELFGRESKATLHSKDDLVVVFETEEDIRQIVPDINGIKKLNTRGVIVTAPGNDVDFVSRFFGPNYGIDEDPVTGSAHTKLIPYWSEKLDKKEMTAKQLSKRGGTLFCKDLGDRVDIGGKSVLYMKGEINIQE